MLIDYNFAVTNLFSPLPYGVWPILPAVAAAGAAAVMHAFCLVECYFLQKSAACERVSMEPQGG